MGRSWILLGLGIGCLTCGPDDRIGGSIEWPTQPAGLTADRIAGLSLPGVWPFGASLQAAAERQWMEQQYRALGIRYLRFEQLWRQWEPTPGSIVTEDADRKFAHAEAGGVEPVVILDYGNVWATPGGCSFDPDDRCVPTDPNDFANFANSFASFSGSVAARYAGRAAMWEVWNEPNHYLAFWVGSGAAQPDRYGSLLKAASAAVRAVDDAPILFGGALQSLDGLGFIEDVYSTHSDIGTHFDVMAYHPYRTHPPNRAPESSINNVPLAQSIADVRSVMQQAGDDKPVAVTELGWPTYPHPSYDRVTRDEHARWLVRSFIWAAQQGVEVFSWFTLMDQDPSVDCDFVLQESCFGLFEYDADPADDVPPVPKKAFHAYAQLMEVLAGKTYHQDRGHELGLDPTSQYAHEFVDSSEIVTVLWGFGSSAAEVVEVPLHVGASTSILDMTGNILEELTGANATVNLGEDPVYVKESRVLKPL